MRLMTEGDHHLAGHPLYAGCSYVPMSYRAINQINLDDWNATRCNDGGWACTEHEHRRMRDAFCPEPPRYVAIYQNVLRVPLCAEHAAHARSCGECSRTMTMISDI